MVAFHPTISSPPPPPFTVHSDFGDGGSTNDRPPSHTYSTAGSYTYTAQLIKNGGIVAQDTAPVTIAGGIAIDAGGPYSGATGAAIAFTAALSNAPAGSSVHWDFGDGTDGTGASVVHAYTYVGIYAVTAGLYLNGTLLSSDSATANIGGGPTAIEAGGPYGSAAGAIITFSSFVSNPPPAYTVRWTFGDGTSAPGNTVTHAYGAGGTYALTATVYQYGSPIASDSAVATISGIVPATTVEADGPYAGIVGQPVGFAASVSNPPPGAAVSWMFGDGASGYGPVTNHRYATPGAYTATVTVYQGSTAIASDSASVSITPSLPSGPIAYYGPGWNLVAGPSGTSFAQADGPLYTFQAGDRAYELVPDTYPVTGGRGYWAYFDAPTAVPLAGTVSPSAPLVAPAGQWVMVGNPSSAATVSVYGADLVLRYDPFSASYLLAASLAPGQGAWAISLTEGVLYVGP